MAVQSGRAGSGRPRRSAPPGAGKPPSGPGTPHLGPATPPQQPQLPPARKIRVETGLWGRSPKAGCLQTLLLLGVGFRVCLYLFILLFLSFARPDATSVPKSPACDIASSHHLGPPEGGGRGRENKSCSAQTFPSLQAPRI